MSNFQFEGDLTGVSERQLEYISGVLEEHGYKNGKVEIAAVGKAGDNYVANVKRISIEKDGKTFKMIAKVAPNNEIMRSQMKTTLMFQNEHIMYTQVLPKFSEFEIESDIPVKDRLRYAACYGSLTEEPNEIILLEDLQLSGFVMLDRFISLTDDSVKLVLKNFAILHSLSYGLRNEEPESYEALKNQLINTWSVLEEVEEMKIFFSQLEGDVLSLLDDEKHKNLIKGSLTKLASTTSKHYKSDTVSKYSIIQQGDSWTNNIMFRLENDKSVQCCMIDYQLSNHNTPVSDLHYMIFNCTDYETRAKHYHDWINYYHSELDRCLANYGLKASKVYPRDQLDSDLNRLGRVAFGMSIMLASILIKESHEAAKFKDAMERNGLEELMDISKLSNMDKSSLVRFKARVEGLIKSFIDFGYVTLDNDDENENV